MKLATRIFKREDWYVTSKFGYRNAINTSAGTTGTFHSGCDYGTSGNKWKQYALENGTILSCGTASDGAKYVWVKYPRLNIKLLHYHLDTISVKKGQSVNSNTVLGTTGKTGKATGIHLHLGLKYLNNDTYVDPHNYDYKEETVKPTKSVEEVAKEVIAGKWGNGEERKTKLRAAGYSYTEVQNKVNELSNKKTTTTKYLNLKPNVSSWAVYKTNNYYNSKKESDVLIRLNPKKFGGLSYKIYEDKGNYHFKIKTANKGYGYIAGNPNKYSCTITDKPTYKNGNY
jgi:hypothetical protein